MALSVAVVEAFTQGRLDQQDADTARALAAALAAARRYCGWTVTPVATETDVKRNGSGTRLLVLRTLTSVTLDEITENGIELVVDDIEEDADAPGHLYKKSGAVWAWGRSNIVVSYSHGFAEAPDFEAAVLSSIDRVTLEVGGARRAVGPFQYSDTAGQAFTEYERNILDLFRLERAA